MNSDELKEMLLKNNLSLVELKLLYIDVVEITHEAKEPRYPIGNGLMRNMYLAAQADGECNESIRSITIRNYKDNEVREHILKFFKLMRDCVKGEDLIDKVKEEMSFLHTKLPAVRTAIF